MSSQRPPPRRSEDVARAVQFGGRAPARVTAPDDPVAVLQRWADAGAVWRVVNRRRGSVTVALYRCDGGEEVDRISSTDPNLLRFLVDRTSSQD
jgi:hypothetical protein